MNSIDSEDEVKAVAGNGGVANVLGDESAEPDPALGRIAGVRASSGSLVMQNSDIPMGREFAAGEVIADRYKVLSVIGRGGFGSVYKVFQLLLKKEFALKTLNPSNMSQTTILRLSKEAQAIGRLTHANLVQAVDFGMLDGVQPYMVMEYVEGATLAQYLKNRGRVDLKEALELFLPLVDALGHAHKEGIIHRDLKPSNIILSPADLVGSKFIPKIVDFGIAKIQCGEALTLTGTGDVFGTPLYMSPEQCSGTGADSRSDIYSMGCLLFETLTGAPPFRGITALETMMQHGVSPVPSLKEASLGLEFPPALEKVMAKLLAKDPNGRYQNCEQLTLDLTALQKGEFEKIRAIPSSYAGASSQSKKKEYVYPALALVLGIAIGAAVFSTLSGFQKTPQFKEPIPAAIPTRSLDSQGLLHLEPSDEESDFFLRRANDKLVFHRPPGRAKQFGQFVWWQKGKLEKVSAVDGAEMPKRAKLIFEAHSAMLEYPYYWGHFRPDELYGVLLQPHSCYLDYQINMTMGQMPIQDNLRLLTMADKGMSQKAFDSIGEITNLRWLDLDKVTVGDSGELTGEQVAKLRNLGNLKVLSVDSVSSVTPILKELSKGSQVRRLALWSKTGISLEDVKLLSKLPHVDTLRLRGLIGTSRDALIDELAKVPNLQRLELDYLLPIDLQAQRFKKLSHLKILSLARIPDENLNDTAVTIRNSLPQNIEFIYNLPEKDQSMPWFDPLKVDLDKEKLW